MAIPQENQRGGWEPGGRDIAGPAQPPGTGMRKPSPKAEIQPTGACTVSQSPGPHRKANEPAGTPSSGQPGMGAEQCQLQTRAPRSQVRTWIEPGWSLGRPGWTGGGAWAGSGQSQVTSGQASWADVMRVSGSTVHRPGACLSYRAHMVSEHTNASLDLGTPRAARLALPGQAQAQGLLVWTG